MAQFSTDSNTGLILAILMVAYMLLINHNKIATAIIATNIALNIPEEAAILSYVQIASIATVQMVSSSG